MKDGYLFGAVLFALPALVVPTGLFWLWNASVVPEIAAMALPLTLPEPI